MNRKNVIGFYKGKGLYQYSQSPYLGLVRWPRSNARPMLPLTASGYVFLGQTDDPLT